MSAADKKTGGHRKLLCSLGSLLAAALLSCAAAAQQIDYVTVTARGEGASARQATYSALADAVTQVNGASLAAESAITSLTAAADTEQGSSFSALDTSAESITTATQGVVKEYRILEQGQHPDTERWTVSLEVVVANYSASEQTNRKRLAILPLRMTHAGQRPANENLVSHLAALLTQSRKFAVLDRDFEAERQSEMAVNQSAFARPEELARLGNRLGTDYMLVGRIEEAAVIEQRASVGGRELVGQQARLSLHYRVVDAATGQIKYADAWSGTRDGQDPLQLVRRAAREISQRVLAAIYPVTVEALDGDRLILGQGGDTLQVGDHYQLIRQGEPVIDSYTGESLGPRETPVGRVRITRVAPKMAEAVMVEGNEDLRARFDTAFYILRAPQATTADRGAAPVEAIRDQGAEQVNTLRNDIEDDF